MPDIRTELDITINPVAGKGVQVRMPNGLDVFITEVILGPHAPDQPSVFINTEEMSGGGLDGGMPEIQVCLNDATLYDREPGGELSYQTIYVVASELSDPPAVFASRIKAEQFAETYDPPRNVDALLVCEAELADQMIAERAEETEDDYDGRPDDPDNERMRDIGRALLPTEED